MRCRLLALVILIAVGCDRARDMPATRPAGRRVASLSPAATDLILGMQARDALVAVSNHDVAQPLIAALPRAGDYQNTDWELLSRLRPQIMVVQLAEARMPPGLRQRAGRLGIELVNIRIERLEDIFSTLQVLGQALDRQQAAQVAVGRLRGQLQSVQASVAGRPPVKALIVCDTGTLSIAGSGNFLDDLLRLAGGVNVAADFADPWPTIDVEKLWELAPPVVLQMVPQASAQQLKSAQEFWARLPKLPAVRDGRVYTFTDWYMLHPGYEVGLVARKLAAALHPSAATAPATASGGTP